MNAGLLPSTHVESQTQVDGNPFRFNQLGICSRLFFLPAYSPDLNPIEQLFSKIKHHMRAAMARSVDAVHGAVATALDAVLPAECSNYFLNSGYTAT